MTISQLLSQSVRHFFCVFFMCFMIVWIFYRNAHACSHKCSHEGTEIPLPHVSCLPFVYKYKPVLTFLFLNEFLKAYQEYFSDPTPTITRTLTPTVARTNTNHTRFLITWHPSTRVLWVQTPRKDSSLGPRTARPKLWQCGRVETCALYLDFGR